MKKSTALALFFLGIIIGLLLSPAKNGITNRIGNKITYNYPPKKENGSH